MWIFLFFLGLALSLGTWLVALRPYLAKKGLKGWGADFGQSFARDWSIAAGLARSGDKQARSLHRQILLGVVLLILGTVGLFAFGI